MNQQASCGPIEHWKLSEGKVATLHPVGSQDAKMLEFMRFLAFEIMSSAKGPQIKIVSRPLDDMAAP